MSPMKEKKVEDVIESKDSRVYEVGYLLVPTIPEDEAPVLFGNIKEMITALNGVVISDDLPKMTALSYVMVKVIANTRKKFDNAYFGWIKFELDPEALVELKKKLEAEENIIRFLITKTVRENTIASRRIPTRDISKRKKEVAEGEATPINKEAIDKEIEAMIAE